MRMINKKNLIISATLSLLGVAFLIYYIYRASTDVVASDYIRIINYYLKDVTDLHLLFSWEGISRMPFTFLARFINVKYFGYSVFFDRILGTIGLFIFNTVTVYYILNHLKTKIIKIASSILTTYISFSLISWEMILNGTGYTHFIAVGLIALTFYHYAKYVSVGANATPVGAKLCEPTLIGANAFKSLIITLLLIIITSLLFAGPYAVSYLCTIIIFSLVLLIYGIVTKKIISRYAIVEFVHKPDFWIGKRYYPCGKNDKYIVKYYPIILLIIIPLICLLLYFKSNNTGEALIPVGFKDISLLELLKTNPLFPIKFLLKSLASSIIGVETFNYALNFGTISEKMIFFIGFIYLVVIIYSLVLLFKMLLVAKGNLVGAKLCEPAAVGAKLCEPAPIGAMHREPAFVGAKLCEPAPVGAKHREPEHEVLTNMTTYKSCVSTMESYTFVLMFLVCGIANYALVFLARYKFVEDSYGMSSRYGIQYMFLTIAVLFILFSSLDDFVAHKVLGDVGAKLCEPANIEENFRSPLNAGSIIMTIVTIASIGFILLGHLTTNTDEIFKSDYRKIIYGILEDKAKNYKTINDEDLENSFEYHRGVDQIREALSILEDQNLNIFRK